MKSIEPNLWDGIFHRIGKEWTLITASDGEKTNAMTASWGCFGVLWNKPVAVCFIRPQRYTYEFAHKAERLTLSFFSSEYRDALSFFGTKSGRDCDKFAATGLTLANEGGVPYPREAETVLVCRKLYVDRLKKESFLDPALLSHYPIDDFHDVFVCEIETVLSKN